MKRQFLLTRLLLLFALIVGSVHGWAGETITLTATNLNLSTSGSYPSGEQTEELNGITYKYTDLMRNNATDKYIQAKASTGCIYNVTAFSQNIKSVAITHSGTGRSTTIYGSADGTNWTQVNTGSGSITGDFTSYSYKYFKITRGANAAYWTQIVITCKDAEVTTLSIKTPPTKVRYEVGETLDMSGFVLNADGSDVSTGYTMKMGESDILNGATLSSAGKKNLVVSYGGKTVNQNISVGAVTSIAVTTPPTKTSYDTGDSFDPTGMVITASLSTGELSDPDTWTKEVTGYTVDPEDDLTPSNNEVTITYATKTAKQAITVTDVAVTGVSLNKTSTSITCGSTETLTETITPNDATIKTVNWSSSNESVATVEDGVVTAKAVGIATITVTTEDGSKTATCDITVTADATKPSLINTVFYESFDKCSNTGGNDGTWSGNVGAEYKTSDGDNTWSMTKGYAANKCVKMGTGSAKGVAITPALALEAGKTYTLSFRAGAFSGKSTNLKVSMSNGTLSANNVTMKNAAFDDFELIITNASANAKITFEGNAKDDSQYFLDEVKVTTESSIVDVTLNAAGFASYCSPFALDLTPTSDYAAYAVKTIGENKVKFTKIPGKVAAKTPFILYNEDNAGETVNLPIIEDDDAEIAPVSENALIGTLSPTYVSNPSGFTNFGMSGSKFVPMEAGVVRANKAYLQVDNKDITTGSESRSLQVIFDEETTGISNVEITKPEVKDNVYYNLNGQRVANPSKGLYIVNGKKVIINK